MGLPWYLNPLWEWDLHDRLDVLEGSSSSSRADDQRQDKEIERLKTRVTELENQLLVLEKILADQGLLPPAPPDCPVADIIHEHSHCLFSDYTQ